VLHFPGKAGNVNRILLTLAFACYCAVSQAQTEPALSQTQVLSQRLQSLQADLTQLAAERATLREDYNKLGAEVPKLESRKQEIAAADAQLKPTGDNLNRKIEAHNKKCTGSFDDDGFVAACNGEKAQIDAESARYKTQRDALQGKLDQLNRDIQDHENRRVLMETADEKKRRAALQDVAEIQTILKQLAPTAARNDKCKAAIDEVDKHPGVIEYLEKMHAVCGQLFDGN
jgi:chromosome segregation ATPase